MSRHMAQSHDTKPADEFQRLVAQEMLIESATEKLLELMEREDVSRAELARRIGKSRAFITQVMDGSRNMTLRTVADLAYALGHELRLEEATPAAATPAEPRVRAVTDRSFWAHHQVSSTWGGKPTAGRTPPWRHTDRHLHVVRVNQQGEPVLVGRKSA